MDQETQIAEELKKKIPEDSGYNLGDGKYPEPDASEVNTEPDHSSLPLENYVLNQEVAEFLSLPRGYKNNPEMVTQMERVISWAKDMAGTTETSDILHVLARRQGEMGIRGKEDRLQRLYGYVKVSAQIDALYEKQRGYYG